jgi:hypothetical protein
VHENKEKESQEACDRLKEQLEQKVGEHENKEKESQEVCDRLKE